METVLITGASGLVGTRLTAVLQQAGYAIKALTRGKSKEQEGIYHWDTDKQELEANALASVDYIVHLAGAGIAEKRWTKKRKQLLYDSRIKSSVLLHSTLRENGHLLKAFIGTSAIGYYGDRAGVWLNEADEPGNDFLAKLCIDWEAHSAMFDEISDRVTILRFGIVLSEDGGALPEMEKGIKPGIAAYLGDGKQFYSWIHIDDLCRIILLAIQQNDMKGIFNAVSPNPVTNKEFTKALAKAKKMPTIALPTPAFALKLALGEMSAAVLSSQRCSAEKLIKSGYEFQYPKLEKALGQIYS